MSSNISQNEQKLIAILKYAPVGLIEIDWTGSILTMNIMAERLLAPINNVSAADTNNLFPVLHHIHPEMEEKIKEHDRQHGPIFQRLYTFAMPIDGILVEKHFNIVANVQVDDTIMISIDDFTERYNKELRMRQIEVEKAVEQGKYEIVSGVLHDIGNAVVGFGSYLTRTKRQLEQDHSGDLQNLVRFFTAQQATFSTVIGEQKAKAIVDLLTGIYNAEHNKSKEINNSITEQLNIISHIQEILNIQRQYISGHASQKRTPVNIRSVINDCIAMLYASFDKRDIMVSINADTESPIVKGDRTKLMQVILNVLKNSLEAIDINASEKKVSINIETSADRMVLQIKDTGHGFDEDTRKQLFERNFTTKPTGSGIGLYNCKAIIESHAGNICMSSDGPGQGASTTIEFNLN